MRKALIVAALGILAFLTLADPVWAIPAFARKYSYSCTTCHAPAPRLKPFGEEFAGRGFRLEDPTQEPERATRDTGDPLLQLMREVPLAARLDGFAAYKEGAEAEYDFEYPWAFKVLSGGPISDKISYYFYYIIEKGGESGLEDAYLQFNRPFNLPFDLLFGQFQICDPLFKRELKLERNDYMIYKVAPGESGMNLTYDRGVMAVSTLPGNINMVLGLYNGAGLGHASGDDHNYDADKEKSYSARLARQFGPVRLGLFGFQGDEKKILSSMPDYEDSVFNTVSYWGPDLVINFGENIQFNLQYMIRNDDNGVAELNYGGAVLEEMETEGGFAELVWLPKGTEGRWAVALLYNNIDSDDPAAVIENVSATVNYLLARNIRFLAEVENDFEGDRVKASIGVSAAF